jgi:hypothetical protein
MQMRFFTDDWCVLTMPWWRFSSCFCLFSFVFLVVEFLLVICVLMVDNLVLASVLSWVVTTLIYFLINMLLFPAAAAAAAAATTTTTTTTTINNTDAVAKARPSQYSASAGTLQFRKIYIYFVILITQ